MKVSNPNVHDYEDSKPKRITVRHHLLLFVFLPTLLAAVYYYCLAADVYVSESKFSVNVEGSSNIMNSPLAALIPPAVTTSGSLHESSIVKEFIYSPQMIDMLKKKAHLENIYDNRMADAFAKIPRELKMEDYKTRYQDKIEVVIDDATGITTLRVRAFSPQDAKNIADNIINYTEDYVNKMSSRVQADALNFAKEEVTKSEKMVMDSLAKIAAFRAENRNFDPNIATTNIVGITSKLEQELAITDAQIATLRNYMQPDNPQIKSLESRSAALRQQVGVQSNRITDPTNSTLAGINDQYSALIIQRDFNLKRLEVTLTAMESAQAEALKKRRYLLRIVEPTLPQQATEPRKLREVLTIFFALLTIYTLGSLIISAIKDHVRP